MVTSSATAEPVSFRGQRVFGEFCRAVGRIVQGSPEKETPARVAALLPGLLSEPALLNAAQTAVPADGYGRHKVFICPDDTFSVLAMVWPPGVSTPIHDHHSWCAFGLYRGMIEEIRYRPASVSPERATATPVARFGHRSGDVGCLPVDAPDIHRMHNPTADPAISIHVYGGNFDKLGPNLGRVYVAEA